MMNFSGHFGERLDQGCPLRNAERNRKENPARGVSI
jgi:hypothetical protein